MLKLCESQQLIDLRLLASYLEKEGIAVTILNEHQAGLPGSPHWALSVWPELWINDSNQFEKATKLMLQYQTEQNKPVTGEWTCGRCREMNPNSFDSCWKCGRSNQDS